MIEASRQSGRRRRQRGINDDNGTKFDERHLAELVRQNMRANNVYVPTGYRCVLTIHLRFLSHVRRLTRDIDIAILSVRLYVCLPVRP